MAGHVAAGAVVITRPSQSNSVLSAGLLLLLLVVMVMLQWSAV